MQREREREGKRKEGEDMVCVRVYLGAWKIIRGHSNEFSRNLYFE